jgi:hypothetical protein
MIMMKLLLLLLFLLALEPTGKEVSAVSPASSVLQNNGRYLDAGIEDDRKFEKWFKVLQGYIRQENRSKIIEHIQFPLDVRISKRDIRIRNRQEFLTYYNELFTKEVKEVILAQKPRNLLVSYKGVMVGNGELWINKLEGKAGYWITAINN